MNHSTYIINKIKDSEKELCMILARMAYFIHPDILMLIQQQNRVEFETFKKLFSDKIEISHYLFEGSACLFPGTRRYTSGKGVKKRYNVDYRAIVDDNTFPRHIWCFLSNGKTYNGPNWKASSLNEFELAHIFSHKETELRIERNFFDHVDKNLSPNGDFTCPGNVILLPKGTIRPTDISENVKSVFFKRYIDLYGEPPLNGRSNFRHDKVPVWYKSLKWNAPWRPNDWEENTEKALKYRSKRIKQILEREGI